MGYSFVYNSGSADDDKKKDELRLEFGIFIDGTLNNKKNTSLRRKYRGENEHSTITKAGKKADEEIEKDDYDWLTEKGVKSIPKDPKNPTEEEKYYAYLEGIHKGVIEKMLGGDNSYSNDDTNITRMWNCCDEKYAIYIEGMGTTDSAKDSKDGAAFGSGQTGIRSRVRLACERIAEEILKVKEDNNKVTRITLDVFGFSRGAAAARNFVYEVKAKKPYKLREITIPNGIESYREAFADADGVEIDPKLLIEDSKLLTKLLKDPKLLIDKTEMPRLGHLGYSLLKNKAVTRDELKEIEIIIRFVGIYDTVSSYYEIGDLGDYDKFGRAVDDISDDEEYEEYRNIRRKNKSADFGNDVEELHLMGNGTGFQKMVHFTAQDEHRENFALTRINQIPDKAIEKNLPGVHSDIGGGYENEEEERVSKIEIDLTFGLNTKHNPMVYPVTPPPPTKLEKFTKYLIEQYWYRQGEIHNYENTVLTGVRKNIKKEYSYIPLHFMEEFCRQTTMDKKFIDKTEDKYPVKKTEEKYPVQTKPFKYFPSFSIYNTEENRLFYGIKEKNPPDEETFLEKVKKKLHHYVFEDGPEWEFLNDEQLKQIKIEAEKTEAEKIETEEIKAEKIKEEEELKKAWTETEYTSPVINPGAPIQLQEVTIINVPVQELLRELRHGYLHWSSRFWFGLQPAKGRKRICYPEKQEQKST